MFSCQSSLGVSLSLYKKSGHVHITGHYLVRLRRLSFKRSGAGSKWLWGGGGGEYVPFSLRSLSLFPCFRVHRNPSQELILYLHCQVNDFLLDSVSF